MSVFKKTEINIEYKSESIFSLIINKYYQVTYRSKILKKKSRVLFVQIEDPAFFFFSRNVNRQHLLLLLFCVYTADKIQRAKLFIYYFC